MPWKLPTLATAWEGILAVLGLLVLMFKKEILDLIKDGWRGGAKSLKNWRQRRNFVRQVTGEELKTILDSGLEELETSLYFLLEEYKADRVTITEYEPQPDGGALVTCLAQVRLTEMKSVRNLQKTPIKQELWHEIDRIKDMDHRLRYVEDARESASAAMRIALQGVDAWSAYYQIISEPSAKTVRLFSMSWKTKHMLDKSQINILRYSGLFCSNALSNMDRWKQT